MGVGRDILENGTPVFERIMGVGVRESAQKCIKSHGFALEICVFARVLRDFAHRDAGNCMEKSRQEE
jgi:hypothetical protein